MLLSSLRDCKQENCSASAAGPSPPYKDSKKPHVTDSEAAIFVIPKAEPHWLQTPKIVKPLFFISKAAPEPAPAQPRFKDKGCQCDFQCGRANAEPKTVTSVA